MEIISSREFRQHQRKYYDKIDEGKEVIIKRGKNKSYRITPIKEEDIVSSKKKLKKKIQEARKEKERGELVTVNPDDLWESIS